MVPEIPLKIGNCKNDMAALFLPGTERVQIHAYN